MARHSLAVWVGRASDIVISRRDVQFGFSEVRWRDPAIVSVVCLRKLGTHHGMVFLTGERFDGDLTVAMGLAHRAVEEDELHSAVKEEIDMISRRTNG